MAKREEYAPSAPRSGQAVGKGIATVAIWAGVAVLSYLFNSFGILNGEGATWLVVGAFLLTGGLWKL